MNKYNKLREYINERLHLLRRCTNDVPSKASTQNNLAIELELKFLLQKMDNLDLEERNAQEQQIEDSVKEVNDALSDSAEFDWIGNDNGFLYTGIPTFDRQAYRKIRDNIAKRNSV